MRSPYCRRGRALFIEFGESVENIKFVTVALLALQENCGLAFSFERLLSSCDFGMQRLDSDKGIDEITMN